jgi:dethiobiotin synthetase
MKQEEYRMINSQYNVVPCKPVSSKVNKAPADKAELVKQKNVKEQKERPRNPP